MGIVHSIQRTSAADQDQTGFTRAEAIILFAVKSGIDILTA
jgi:hypothetical protein